MAYKLIPVLMLTAKSASDTKISGKSAGIIGWIVQLFNLDKLIGSVQKVLR